VSWESGRLPFDGKPPKITPPLKHELCYLKRRRMGLTQKEVGEELGYTKYWVRLMEQGRVDSSALERYWKC